MRQHRPNNRNARSAISAAPKEENRTIKASKTIVIGINKRAAKIERKRSLRVIQMGLRII